MKRAIIVIAFVIGFAFGWAAAVPTASAQIGQCRVVKVLEKAGFTGNNLRIAYAVVMRESKGAKPRRDFALVFGCPRYFPDPDIGAFRQSVVESCGNAEPLSPVAHRLPSHDR